jgi:RHS repeat-associated protein
LTQVDESGSNWSNDRVRTFTYDSLSRLTSISNPEGSTINYTYDSNGNTLTKVNGRGTTISYQYDALNRLTSKSYNDGVTPTANFVYDACPSGGCPSGVSPQYPVGRMVKAYSSSAQTFYSYDVRGRNAEQWQCTPVNCGTSFIAFTYTHNYIGGQSSISYNGNFTISQAYDAVGRITQLTNSNSNTYNPATIVSLSQISPIGAPTQLGFGNGLAETRAYNPRLQPTQLRVYSPPSTDVLNQTYTWGDPQYSNYDNGVLWGWAASGSGTPTFSRTYTYDGMNRLATMSSPADPSGCTGLSWIDDAWANRTAQTVTGGTCGQSSLTINTSNEITNTGFTYDSDGNLTAGTSPYQYDAEDRITQFNNGPSYGGANYVYDPNGRRIEKVTSGGQTHYFYDENGHVIVETDHNGNWTKDYVYMGGKHVAEFYGGQTYFIHTDHLGSTRTVTNYQGSITDSLDYLPYGEQIAGGTFSSHKFTGYERDAESGLDYASARYYNAGLGRFMSVDPVKGDTATPQSYNRYAYVQNNPLASTDPSGTLSVGLSNPCGMQQLAFEEGVPVDSFFGLDLGFGDDFDWTDTGNILGRGIACMEWIVFAEAVAARALQPAPPPPPNLIMVEDVDCQENTAAFRDVAYYLREAQPGGRAPTALQADYYVTEHLSGASAGSLTPNGRGTSTSGTADYFSDRLGCYQTCRPGNSSQTFSATSASGPPVSNIAIMFHETQVAGNTNSLTLSSNGRVTINGTGAPEFCNGTPIRNSNPFRNPLIPGPRTPFARPLISSRRAF